MKKRHLIFINIMFFGLTLFSAGIVYEFLTGNHPLERLFSFGRNDTVAVTTNACSSGPALPGIAELGDAQLKRLAVYQEACHSYVTNTLMTFVSMPVSQQNAIDTAQQVGAKLQAFAKAGVRPLVIAEPADNNGGLIDFAELAAGNYDQWIDVYFAHLKSLGITDQQMGIWNPLPEANLPYWKNNQPAFFAPSVNRYVAIAHKYFPALQTSILLNSATYETTDFNWENGDYQSLMPFIKGITPGTIQYVGLQGFPWTAPQGGTAAILNAAEFLNPALLSEMADVLKIKNVWFNTGTFSVRYALDPARIVYISPEQRKGILTTVETQASLLKAKGYNVAINMFAKDKSRDSEETNWSYWAGNQPFGSLSTPVFTEFASDLTAQNINLWLFDE